MCLKESIGFGRVIVCVEKMVNVSMLDLMLWNMSLLPDILVTSMLPDHAFRLFENASLFFQICVSRVSSAGNPSN
jgi:hypothetical protein